MACSGSPSGAVVIRKASGWKETCFKVAESGSGEVVRAVAPIVGAVKASKRRQERIARQERVKLMKLSPLGMRPLRSPHGSTDGDLATDKTGRVEEAQMQCSLWPKNRAK